MALPIQDSVRRMALISEQLYENLKANAQKQRLTESPEFTKARVLDNDISAILQNPQLSAYDKYQRYANALKEFTLFHTLARAQQEEPPTTTTGVESLLQTLISTQQQQQPVTAPLPAAPVAKIMPPLPFKPPPPLEPAVFDFEADGNQQQLQEAFSTPTHSPTEIAAPAALAPVPVAATASSVIQAKTAEQTDVLQPKDIIEAFSGKKKDHVENMMGIFAKYPDKFDYNKTTGELQLSGKPVKGAELLPILGYVTSSKKGADVPEGTARFLHQLQLVKDDLRPVIPNAAIRAAAVPVFRSSFLGTGKKLKQSKLRVIRWEPY